MVLFMRTGLQANEWMGHARHASAHGKFIHTQPCVVENLFSMSVVTLYVHQPCSYLFLIAYTIIAMRPFQIYRLLIKTKRVKNKYLKPLSYKNNWRTLQQVA